jgi:hypothetical protein
MSAKSVCLGGLVAAFLGAGLARAQVNQSPSVGGEMGGLDVSPTNPGAIISDSPKLPGNVPFYSGPQSLQTPGSAGANPPPAARATLSSWILYPRSAGCCGPTGGNGPIAEELFLNVGPSFNIGGGILGNALDTGWDIEGGARTLFFNTACDAAWTVSFSVSNINNHAGDQTEKVNVTGLTTGQTGIVSTSATTGLPTINTLRALQFGINPTLLDGTTSQVLGNFPLTVRSLNRTYANLGVGRDWYLWGPAHVEGISAGELPNLRVGVEVGGRWGTEELEVNETTRRMDTIGGTYFAIYGDVEYPWHCCVFTAGLRTEYGYTWTDILQHQNRTDIQDLNVLLTLGVRF